MHNEAVKAMRYPPEAPKASVFSLDAKKDVEGLVDLVEDDLED